MVLLTRDLEEELREDGGDELVDEIRSDLDSARNTDRMYPKPTEGDVNELRQWLEELYRPLHEGTGTFAADGRTRYTGLRGLRDLRYGRDATPEKLKVRLNNDVRVRAMQIHRMIFNVRSLLGRNPMKVTVPAASASEAAQKRATQETRWANELQNAFERRALFSPIQESDDAQCEAFGGWEVYLTGSYDGIDFEQGDEEDEKDYEERVTTSMRSAGLPFGIRALDPLSTLIDPTDDGDGVNACIIVERKRARPFYRHLRAKYGDEVADRVTGGNYGEAGFDTNGAGEVECLRYYDGRWYAYMVNGAFVDGPREHGFPGTPIFPAWGYVTSARNLGDKLQGVAYAQQFTEAVTNDTLTQQVDSQLTYNRPKPIASVSSPDVPPPTTTNIDLSSPDLQVLDPGYQLDDAFKHFRATQLDPTIQLLISLGSQHAINPVVAGAAPGADTSGFALNLQTSNAIAPYTTLFRSKELAWGRVVDFCRRLVRDTIREPVMLPSMGKDDEGRKRVDWLELTPDEVTDIPCEVSLDPLSDLERVALAEYLKGGVLGQWVPEDLLMEMGYGSDDPDEWRIRIDRDAARRMLREWRVQQAFRELVEEEQLANAAPVQSGLVGPNGQPLPPSGGDMQAAGALPAEPQPSSLGRQAMTPGGMNPASALAGQQPSSQPLMPGQGGPR